VERLRAGDGAAFEALLRDHGSWMMGLARRLLGDDGEAEDAVQDACLSAFRGIGSFEGGSRLATWLHRVVVNAALMRLRARRRRPERPFDVTGGAFSPEGGHAGSVLDWTDQPARALEADEVRQVVRGAVADLPASYRSVFVLRDVEGLPMDEVARLLDLTVSGAKSRLHRARQELRRVLAQELFADDRPAIRAAR
jgi:RNA polymerase sigma-70 factor (ECF subfamily)